jgi:parallel beta-helix repeat protein
MFNHHGAQAVFLTLILFLSCLGFISFLEDSEINVQAANTLYVGSNVTYQQIQGAIDNASPGDEILVYNGTYYEDLVIQKKISLRGIDFKNTVINGTGTGHTIHISANEVKISGFTITGGSSEWGSAGVLLESVQECRIDNNIVTKNGYYGIRILLSENILVDNNSISENPVAGIGLDISESNTIENNDISPGNLVGVALSLSKKNYIEANKISYSEYMGIDAVDSNENYIRNNDISFNTGNAIEFWNSNDNHFNNNIISKNQEDGIHLQSSRNNTFKNNKLTENGFSIAGFSSNDWDSHIIESSNTVNGKTVYYKENEPGGSIPAGAGQVILTNCSNIYVENQIINDTSEGIILGYTSHCIIRNNKVTSNSRHGISLWKSNNNVLDNNEVTSNHDIGISCIDSSSNVITENRISNNKHGVVLRSARNHKVRNNTFNDNGLFISGNLFDFWRVENTDKLLDEQGKVLWAYSKAYWNSHTIEETNTVNGKPIVYWKNRAEGTIPPEAGQVILGNCSNIIIDGQNLSDVTVGIELGFSSNNIVTNNIASSNVWQGIYLESSSHNTVDNNTFSENNRNGILLDYSTYNSISFNKMILNADNGAFLYFSDNNTILNNSVMNNNGGLLFEFANDNEIAKNTIQWNNEFGQYFDSESHRNNIFHNNFIENFNQATDFGTNQWYLLGQFYRTGSKYIWGGWVWRCAI